MVLVLPGFSSGLGSPSELSEAYQLPSLIPLRSSSGNSMNCSDIWHKYHEWYFEIVIHNIFWENFEISRVVFMPNIKYKSCYYLFTLSTTRKGFEIFTARYFKLSWNTTAPSQSIYINFSCSRDKSGNWSWIELILNHTCDLKIERERKSLMISDQSALHWVQLPLCIQSNLYWAALY